MLEHPQYFGEDGLQDERENVKLWHNNALYADEVVEWVNACFDIFDDAGNPIHCFGCRCLNFFGTQIRAILHEGAVPDGYRDPQNGGK